MSFPVTLTLILITLKLLEVITWSWWWVLSPMWIGFAILMTMGAIVFLIVVSRL